MGKYSETLTEHVMVPRNGGWMENPDVTGHAGAPGRGAFIIRCLKIQDERIAAAKALDGDEKAMGDRRFVRR